MSLSEFAASAAATAVLTMLIKGGVAVFGHSIHWLAALLISAVLVYGGFLFIDGDWID